MSRPVWIPTTRKRTKSTIPRTSALVPALRNTRDPEANTSASEAHAEYYASVRGVFNRKAILWQAGELGRVDHGGGGTVALFLAAYGMNVVDCGPARLAVHSPFELSSVVDIYACFEAYRAFYEA